MSLSELRIHNLRNIETASFHFHPKLNVILGCNGSGKTTLIEALYLLGTGHSFRTRQTASLVKEGQDSMTVFARTHLNETVSLQKSISGQTLVKLNQYPCRSSSELAHFLPTQVFYQDIFHIIDAGPTIRRSILDWGMFHVKHSFFSVWKNYRKAVKHRNALLKQKQDREQLLPWDKHINDLGNQLHVMREQYFQSWISIFKEVLYQLSGISCSVTYFKGWDKKNSGKSLQQILSEQFDSDRIRQYTQSGAHQADLVIETGTGKKAKEALSRGQQKIILIALKLAQAKLLEAPCLLLLDDMTAELDHSHINTLLAYLTQHVEGQIFITGLNETLLSFPALKHSELLSFYIEDVQLNALKNK